MNKIPLIGQKYKHPTSGEIYKIYDIINLFSEERRKDAYSIRISYIRLSDDTRWSRDLASFWVTFENCKVE